MIRDFISYNGVNYPYVVIDLPNDEVITVGGEMLQRSLLPDGESYASDAARFIYEKIGYFVSEKVLLSDEDAILAEIKEIDPEIFETEKDTPSCEEFLVQILWDDNSVSNRICKELEVVKLQNESDFNGIADMKVYACREINDLVPLEYKGWQPGCLIEFVDPKGKVVISGFGEDH